MPQSRNDHPDDRNLDIKPGLIKDEEIKPKTLGKLHASQDLFAPIESLQILLIALPGGALCREAPDRRSCADTCNATPLYASVGGAARCLIRSTARN